MRALLTVVMAVLAGAVPPGMAYARCGDGAGDAQAIADARAQVGMDCDCAGAASHGSYVRCARGVATVRITQGLLPRACKGVVARCAARSTCGKPGFVTCCRTKANGQTKCAVKRNGASCLPPGGGTACVGNFSSCCDACDAGGCVGLPTTTSTSSTTSTTSGTPCGDAFPTCDGACPPGEYCWAQEFPNFGCQCVPVGSTPCIGSNQCGGTCPGGDLCRPMVLTTGGIPSPSLCVCVDPGSVCVPGLGGQSTCPGNCPAAFACTVPTEFPNECLCQAATTCSGGSAYPTCGGTCPAGQACTPAQFGSLLPGQCVCGPAGAPCDATCGGTTCPAGQICRSVAGGGGLSCSCVTP